MPERTYSGNPYQAPIRLRTNAARKTEGPPRTRQQTTRQQMGADEDENPDAWTTKTPTSAIRRTAYLDQRNPKETKRVREHRLERSTLILILSLILIVMVGGWWLLSTLSTWWTNWQDDLHYGTPRTYQTDQFVGQGDSPDHPDHFIVVNTHGQVIVIQLNTQHPELNHTYGITTASDPKVPVSLLFRPSGNNWAMYVVVGDSNPYTVEYVSDGQKFVPATQSRHSRAASLSPLWHWFSRANRTRIPTGYS